MKPSRSPRTRHTATAQGRLIVTRAARRAMRADDELIPRIRVIGELAARRAAESLPQAPSIELDAVDVTLEWVADGLDVTARIAGYARRPIGARALAAVTACANAVVDAHPRHAMDITLERARITEQRGGMAERTYDFDPPVRAAILVVSDAVVGGHKEDRAGRAVREVVESLAEQGVELVHYEMCADDADAVRGTVESWASSDVEFIITVGGTGLVHTDVTIDAIQPLIDREIPGLAEAMRDYGLEQTPLAFISRSIAGLAGDSLVVTFPGSTAGAREAAEAVFPSILHVFHVLRKANEHLPGDSQ